MHSSPKTISCIEQIKSGIATSRSSCSRSASKAWWSGDDERIVSEQRCRILGTIIKPPLLKENDWLRLSSEKLGIQPHPSMFRASTNSGSAAKFADQDIDDFKVHSLQSQRML